MRVDLGRGCLKMSLLVGNGETGVGIQTGGLPGKARAAAPVLANFRQLAGERVVKIHPLVGRLIEPEALERLRAAARAAGLPD